jgi:hypothetical protein
VPVADRLGDLQAVHTAGLVLVVAGVAFKLSLVPFHLWTPDTYAGAPLPIAAFLSTVSKVAGLTAVVLVLAVGAPGRAASWAAPIGVLAVVTMTVGNVVALRQHTAVRLLAWSTVAQAGWVVLPLAGALARGRVSAATSASLGYLLAYVVASLAAFAVVMRVAEGHPLGAQHGLDAYAGLWRRRPPSPCCSGSPCSASPGYRQASWAWSPRSSPSRRSSPSVGGAWSDWPSSMWLSGLRSTCAGPARLVDVGSPGPVVPGRPAAPRAPGHPGGAPARPSHRRRRLRGAVCAAAARCRPAGVRRAALTTSHCLGERERVG